MKSICIKSNNNNYLNYLLIELKHSTLNNIIYSINSFKNYDNLIIHYIGNDNELFLKSISNVLSYLVIDEVEDTIINNILIIHYFYFNQDERNQILELCNDINFDNSSCVLDKKYKVLYECFYNYLLQNKSIVLSGFINFRLQNYISILNSVVDKAVNSYVIKKEYLEFISLLKLYINTKPSTCSYVHLIYSNKEVILLDEEKNVIITTDKFFNTKYLSDISFSSNDYVLNTLLNLLPKTIYIHLIDNYSDEFINTLKLAFENRIKICIDCNICKLYKKTSEISK